MALYQKANLQNASYSDPARADSHVLITNDGATISKSLVLDDPLENMGVCLIQEIASKVNAAAGDGTTTAIVLTQAILHSAFRNLAAGADPVAMRRGIQKAARTATETLLRRARPILPGYAAQWHDRPGIGLRRFGGGYLRGGFPTYRHYNGTSRGHRFRPGLSVS